MALPPWSCLSSPFFSLVVRAQRKWKAGLFSSLWMWFLFLFCCLNPLWPITVTIAFPNLDGKASCEKAFEVFFEPSRRSVCVLGGINKDLWSKRQLSHNHQPLLLLHMEETHRGKLFLHYSEHKYLAARYSTVLFIRMEIILFSFVGLQVKDLDINLCCISLLEKCSNFQLAENNNPKVFCYFNIKVPWLLR